MLSVSVVIPTYNERENIEILVPRIYEAFRSRVHEILVVDDTSPDGTGKAVRRMQSRVPTVRLITKPKREGIGAALRLGYSSAVNDVVASMDSDLSFSPGELLRLVERVEAGGDLVLGSRHSQGGFYQAPNWRIKLKFATSLLGNWVVRRLTGLMSIHDFSANCRAIRRTVWEAIHTTENTNCLLLEMILKVHYAGYRLEEVPVTFEDRKYGQSKLNLGVEAPKFLVKLLGYVWRYRIARRPVAAPVRS